MRKSSPINRAWNQAKRCQHHPIK
ncbi:hypothetical protein [Candidatus Methylopumilus turicensis]